MPLIQKSLSRLKMVFHDTRGVSLIITLGLTMVLLLIAGGIAALVVNFMRVTNKVENAAKAYFAAESGVELALYDLMAYKDGYETDASKNICGSGVDISATIFSLSCSNANKYRFVNLVGTALSGARGFWQIFSRTMIENSGTNYLIPNPYFVGDKNGKLEGEEWGRLTKSQPISLSFMIDTMPSEIDLSDRFTYLSNDAEVKVILMVPSGWDANGGNSDTENIATWTLSAVDGSGEEYTLQGVIREDDFESDATNCPSGNCFVLDFQDGSTSVDMTNGNALVGEDINKNIGETEASPVICPNASGVICSGDGTFNRVSGVKENFNYNTIKDFLSDMNTNYWHDARLSINLIGTLTETSNVTDNALRYKITSTKELADEYNYIVSEGFSGLVKQTIETRFRRQVTIPIFSYVIFQ